jgi:hypothetical protein
LEFGRADIMHLETKYTVGGEDSGYDRLVLESDLGRVAARDDVSGSLITGPYLVLDMPLGTGEVVDPRDPKTLAEVLDQKDDYTFAVAEQALRAQIAERKGRFLHFLGVIKLGWVQEIPTRAKVQPIRPFNDPNID